MRILGILASIAVLTSSLSAQVPSYVPTNGLVGWWPFNGNANDESGNGHNGSVNGATLSPDRDGNQNSAYAFNGSSTNIFISPIPTLTTSGNTGITISCWLNTNTFSQTNTDLFDLRSTDNSSLQFLINNLGAGVVQIQNFDGPNAGGFPPFGSQQTIGTNEWRHLLLTQNNSTNVTRLYIDGQLTDTLLFQIVPLFDPKFTIGSRNDFSGVQSSFFSGSLDDFGIWDRPLDQNEITALFNSQVTPCLSTTSVTFSGLDASYTVNDAVANLVGTPSGGLFIGAGVSGSNFDPAAAGVGTHGIIYTYVDTSGCVNSYAQCTEVTLNVGSGGSQMGADGVRVFPNPNRGQFTVELDLAGLVGLQVFDTRGALVYNEVFTASGSRFQRSLDLSSLAQGNYTLQVQHEGQRITQTVVVE